MRSSLLPLASTLAAATLVALPTTASAQGVAPPPNDDIADATVLADGDSRNDTTVGATRESTDPADLDGEHTVWYVFDSAGGPVQVDTQSPNPDPALTALFTIYRGSPGDLRAIGESTQPELGPSTGHETLRIPTVAGATYYVGVTNRHDGAPYTLDFERTRRPSTLAYPDGVVFGEGRPQLFTPRGERPRVRVLVRTGFPGRVEPARGEVTLVKTDTGRTFDAVLRRGRATFVLPPIRRGYEIIATYAGTGKSDTTTTDAYMNVGSGPQRRHG